MDLDVEQLMSDLKDLVEEAHENEKRQKDIRLQLMLAVPQGQQREAHGYRSSWVTPDPTEKFSRERLVRAGVMPDQLAKAVETVTRAPYFKFSPIKGAKSGSPEQA